MTLPAQGGIFSLATQAAKIGASGTFVTGDQPWTKIPTIRIAGGPVQDVQPFPPEVGGDLTIQGMYKRAKYSMHQVSFIPRMEESFGYFLKGLLGAVTTTAGVDVFGTVAVGINQHIFHFDANPYLQPWMAARVYYPGKTAPYGFTSFDNKFRNTRIVVPQAGKIMAETTLAGRDFQMTNNPSWTYANALMETSKSSVDSGSGTIKIGGVEYPFVNCEILFDNNVSSPTDELIIGEFSPDDFTALGPRVCQIRLTYKYDDAGLWRAALSNSLTGNAWSQTPYETATDLVPTPDVPAFQLHATSPGLVGATAFPYAMIVNAGRVSWDANPVNLEGGAMMLQQITGTVVTPASGVKFLEIGIGNAKVSY